MVLTVQVQLMVCLTLEEVLPRPQTGLLHRMLRLAGVKRLELPGIEEPVFVLHPGTEYMVRLHANSLSQRMKKFKTCCS